MALLTMIARVIDGLPLVGTMQDDEQVSLYSCLLRKQKLISHILNIFNFSDRAKYYGVSESGKNVIPEIGFPLTSSL